MLRVRGLDYLCKGYNMCKSNLPTKSDDLTMQYITVHVKCKYEFETYNLETCKFWENDCKLYKPVIIMF